jgi:hypothetical protein
MWNVLSFEVLHSLLEDTYSLLLCSLINLVAIIFPLPELALVLLEFRGHVEYSSVSLWCLRKSKAYHQYSVDYWLRIVSDLVTPELSRLRQSILSYYKCWNLKIKLILNWYDLEISEEKSLSLFTTKYVLSCLIQIWFGNLIFLALS